jgi:putative oxidoreductase
MRPARGARVAPGRGRIVCLRCMLRRLYSTFADGWPGIGLLGMRLVVGSVVLVRASSPLWSHPPWQETLAFASLAGPGLLLVVGLWTPLAGIAVAAIEISRILTSDDLFARVLAATIAGALAMLGPGRWSVDARLFGWKRIEASPRRHSSTSH